MTTGIEPQPMLESMVRLGDQILQCNEAGIELVLALWAERTKLFHALTDSSDDGSSMLANALDTDEIHQKLGDPSSSGTRELMQAVLDQNHILDAHMSRLNEGLRERVSFTQRRLTFEQTYRAKGVLTSTARMFDERK